MRIAYVFDPLLPSTETDTEQALNTISAFTRHGAEVTMFLPRKSVGEPVTAESLKAHYKVEGDFEVAALRSVFPLPRLLRPVEKVAHALRANAAKRLAEYDLVYTRHLPVVAASLAAGRHVVYETYRPWTEQYPALAPLFRKAMKHPRFVAGILHSGYTREKFISIGAPADKLLVAHNGYQPELFSPELTRQEARAQTELPAGKTVLYAGRVVMKKGLGIALEMAKALPDVNFVFVGSEGHGEFEEAAANLKNVIVRGWVSYGGLAPYLYAADVLLIPPSLGPLQKVGNTVLPMKIFLYLAAGRAILAPRAPDTAELLSHDDNAYLVAPDQLDDAIAAVRALTDEPELAQRLGDASGALGRTLTWDARAAKVLGFLAERMQNRSPSGA